MRGPLIALLGLLLVAATLQGAVGDQPSEYECRPYIEKALKDSLGSLPASSPEDVGSSESDADDLEMMQDDQGDPGASVEDGTETGSVEETGGEVGAEVSTETGESTEGGDSTSVEGVASAEGETLNGEGQVSEGEAKLGVGGTAGEGEASSEEQSTEGEANLEGATEDGASIEGGTPEGVESSEEEIAEGAVDSGESSEEGESLEDGVQGVESLEEGIAKEGKSVEDEIVEGGESLEETPEQGDSIEDVAAEGDQSLEEGPTEGGESLEAGAAEGESLEEGTTEGGESLEAEAEAAEGESLEDGNTEGGESLEEGIAEDAASIESLEGTTEGGESLENETAEKEDSSEEGAVEGGEASLEETSETGESSSDESTPKEGDVSTESTEGGEASVESTEGGEASVESTEGGEASVEEAITEGAASIEGSISEGESSQEGSSEEAAVKEESNASVDGEVVSRKPRSVQDGDGSDAVEGEEASTEAEKPSEEEVSEAEEVAPEPVAPDVVEETPEEELSYEVEIPENLRPREHIAQVLRLDEASIEDDVLVSKAIETTLKELKRFYDNAIKPLEILYKYRDLSNRHFGDPEIFSKPLILFMGPWSGGKSSIINYLLDNEYKRSSLRTGAEPSPAYFNILMWGESEEVLDGTQLAADWTFSGLQKFGQGLLDRLRGLRLNSRLLEKVNIVEIPGILEIRKQVERVFPFNDACQWFIDRADIIFLVYDPAKLDVGPETEAILDQLKGREYQTRIVLNKADQVHPEELMRVQGTLIWNISPLMSSTQPPVMYTTSLWSMPYELGAPLRLLRAQERAFLRDMREAIDRRVENKIASARRFAVRVRNHAKMVDCYLTTYYNHKSFFGNRKHISDGIIEKPQDYHIYEGLSTLTNISRYDLPDPETYRDFFRVNPLYEFQQLAATCTYFKGCPINRLDVAIAYELPELVGKYKKAVETALTKSPPT